MLLEEDDNVELHVVNAKRLPNELSADEFGAHNASHEPFTAWCRACVAGGGLSPDSR